MNTLLILLAQTTGGAILEILFLLLVSVTIGYITAWYFYRTIYRRQIKAVESEKEEILGRMDGLSSEIDNLHKNLQEKNKETDQLIFKVNALNRLHKEAGHKTEDMALKNKKLNQLLHEKDEEFKQFAQPKNLLNFNSFGTATEAEMDDLKMISGIGPFIEERLHAVDIFTFKQISKFTAYDVETINEAIEYFSGRIERDEWIAQARELVNFKEKRTELLNRIRERKERIYYKRIGTARKEEADDLTTISGIGGWIREKLNVLDIYTFQQISRFTDEDVQTITEVIEYFPGRIERDEWILQAQELVQMAGNKADLLKRIRDRKGRIYYDRLGIEHKHRANNLTQIKGIGLWIEERLNTLDIYTYKQISNLTPADVVTITEILEIAPGRIDKDNWVKQARELAEQPLYHFAT